MSVNSCSAALEKTLSFPPFRETLWSCLNWFLKFPSWPSGTSFTHLSTCCFFPLWWAQVKKKSLPSSPTPLLLAQNRMIKARVSHLSNCNNTTVPSKGKMPRCEMTGYWYESVVSFLGEIRGGSGDVCCYVALSDLTSMVEEKCHSIRGASMWGFFSLSKIHFAQRCPTVFLYLFFFLFGIFFALWLRYSCGMLC